MKDAGNSGKLDALLMPGPKLFVIDARHAVERRYLIHWIKAMAAYQKCNDAIDFVIVPISDHSTTLKLAKLQARLAVISQDTLIAPVRIVWRIPGFENAKAIKLRHLIAGDPRMPGSLRARSILMRDKKRAHCIAGTPATFAELSQRFICQNGDQNVQDDDALAGFIARQAGLVLDIEERGLRGRRYKVPRFVAEGLRASSGFSNSITQLAQYQGKPVSKLNAEAAKYMQELIAKPTPLFIDLKARLDRFMLSQGYDDKVVFDTNELVRLRKTMREHPTLLLFTHKTYIDGVTPTDLAYNNDLPMLHVFGGINLDFFGLGFLLRRAGTIFIRRSFENNPVYKLVLRYYVSYLLEKRFPMTWAFEGTRSRLGKLMPPRYGLLKYVLDGAHANNIPNVNIIPVVTSFDLIRDVEEYASEQTGLTKKPESLSWFIGYLRSLRQPMGKVYVDFGNSVIIENAPDPNDRLALSKIAFEVAVEANRVTPLTLTSLMCFCLLGTSPRAMTAEELRAALSFFVRWAGERNIKYSADLLPEKLKEIKDIVDTLVNSGLLGCYDKGSCTVYAIEPDKHPIASYYRNSIIHHFLEKAIIELSLLKAREEKDKSSVDVFWQETDKLRDLFKFEFFYPPKDEYRANLEAELTRVDRHWRVKLAEGGIKLKSLTNRFQPLVGHAVFLPFVESYTIILEILSRLEPGQSIDKKNCVEEALLEGRQAYLLRRISSEASIGKILFENGFKMAANQGLLAESGPETVIKRKELLKKFRALSRRMEKSRLEVLQLADKVFE